MKKPDPPPKPIAFDRHDVKQLGAEIYMYLVLGLERKTKTPRHNAATAIELAEAFAQVVNKENIL